MGISAICPVPICAFSCGQDLLLGAFVVIVEVTSVLRLRMHIQGAAERTPIFQRVIKNERNKLQKKSLIFFKSTYNLGFSY